MEYENEDLDKELQTFYTEVCTKDGLFYNFAENFVNKKSYGPSFISWYMVTRDIFKVLKLHSLAVRAILRTESTKFYPGFP